MVGVGQLVALQVYVPVWVRAVYSKRVPALGVYRMLQCSRDQAHALASPCFARGSRVTCALWSCPIPLSLLHASSSGML